MRAHPRVGGENYAALMPGAGQSGSSPRGRGKHSDLLAHLCCAWLIPAWAGKTTGSRAASRTPAAHPRVGGENAPETSDKDVVTGSSPRGRGKPWIFARQGHLSRLIPAWAGKTRRPRSA